MAGDARPRPPERDPDAPVVQGPRRGRESNAVWRAAAAVAIPLFDPMARLEVRGGEKLPHEGSFVVTPNHLSNIDPVVVARTLWALGRVPRFLAKASLFRVPVFGSLMRAMGHVPVERGGRTHGNNPIDVARALVATGGGVIVYPEGTLTHDDDLWPMRGKSGAVRLAIEAGVPLVPMAHWGGQELLGRYGRRLRPFPRKRIVVALGDPVDLSAYRGRPLDQAALTEATGLVMRRITELLEGIRGERAPERPGERPVTDDELPEAP